MANITTATDLYHTVMASVDTALATANDEIVYLKSKLKTQSKPAEKNKHRYKHVNYCWTHGF